MLVRKFQPELDLQNLEVYLRNQYQKNQNMTSWLPQRLHDLIYRMGTQKTGVPVNLPVGFITEDTIGFWHKTIR